MYILMHENYPVAKIQIDEITGSIVKIQNIYEIDRIPVGVHIRKGILERAELNEWWESRCIPMTRQKYSARINELNVTNAKLLALRNNGLSLSDHYWIKKEYDENKWEEINFYENSFSEDVGNVFCMERYVADIDFRSPDSTSGGWLKKKWEKHGEEEKKPNHKNVYTHLVEMARKHGMEIENFLKHEILWTILPIILIDI